MTYEQKLDELIAKYATPFHFVEYVTKEDLVKLEGGVREHFLETRVELLDIRVIAKVHDILAECNIGPEYSQTSIRFTEVDNHFTVHVTIDPDDPDPELTLNFIAGELKLLHPNVEIRVVEQD